MILGFSARSAPRLTAMRRPILPLLALLSALAVGACTADLSRGVSFFADSAAATPGKVDAAAAARLISEYRASRGLPPVKVDSRLMRIAQNHADRMAAANKMAHVLPGEGGFQRRLADGGFQAAQAAENIAAGQKTLSEVLEAWRNSPSHNTNMLRPGISLIGIASAYSTSGQFKIYWALVLAEPYAPPPVGQFPTAGPVVGSGGFFGRIFGQ